MASVAAASPHGDVEAAHSKEALGTATWPRLTFISLPLRCLQLATSICAFSIVAGSGENGVSYSDFSAAQWLLAATVISTVWSLLALAVVIGQLWFGLDLSGRRLWKHVILWVDFILASMALSGASAVAGVTTMDSFSLFCDEGDVGGFCSCMKAAAAMGFLAFFFFVPQIVIDVLSLNNYTSDV
eukprot:TRINITY_DN106_c0_g1_i2.p1 TRINITY_DN106_c0_g1~~TRINITY_DN106_c0_g1_i2.p1  ORF type:complete len:185 (-),score=22.55 TRINITY_DN106_c0_g1_i2:954-1508(-)